MYKQTKCKYNSTFGSDEVIEVKGVNDDTQSMKIRNEELPCGA
jgi:hypothetical protein